MEWLEEQRSKYNRSSYLAICKLAEGQGAKIKADEKFISKLTLKIKSDKEEIKMLKMMLKKEEEKEKK